MAKKKEEIKSVSDVPLKILIAASPFLVGIYYEWISCIVSVFLIAYLLYCLCKTGYVQVHKTGSLFATVILLIFYGGSIIWAVDHGMAFWGFIKFLPLPLFVLAIGQIEKESRYELLEIVPLSGFVMTIVSGCLSLIPILKEFVVVNERLAGFFQYPNTFALFSLLGIGILICRTRWTIKEIVIFLGLAVGIFLSGSRTVFVLLILTVMGSYFLLKEKRKRLILLGSMGAILILSILFVIITGNMESVGRYLTTSLSSSTLLGRLLYYKDAIPVILQNPLGLGYMGYYFSQGEFQTGVYSVLNVHNELLQILLDVGWIPTACLGYAIIKGFKEASIRNRIVIVLLFLHCMLDFDLQFVVIYFVLLMAIDIDEKNVCKIYKGKKINVGAILIIVISVYFGIASFLYYFDLGQAAVVMYPWNTNALMSMLTEAEEIEEIEKIADRILELNENNSLACSAKARVAYSKGDFANVILYKQKAIRYSKYNIEEYLDYFNMLYIGYQLYTENEDYYSAEQCQNCLLEIPGMLEAVLEETDSLAYKINDKPELELPEEYKFLLEKFNYHYDNIN